MISYFFSKSSASLTTNVGEDYNLFSPFRILTFELKKWAEVADIRVLAAHVFRKRLSIFLYLR